MIGESAAGTGLEHPAEAARSVLADQPDRLTGGSAQPCRASSGRQRRGVMDLDKEALASKGFFAYRKGLYFNLLLGHLLVMVVA